MPRLRFTPPAGKPDFTPRELFREKLPGIIQEANPIKLKKSRIRRRLIPGLFPTREPIFLLGTKAARQYVILATDEALHHIGLSSARNPKLHRKIARFIIEGMEYGKKNLQAEKDWDIGKITNAKRIDIQRTNSVKMRKLDGQTKELIAGEFEGMPAEFIEDKIWDFFDVFGKIRVYAEEVNAHYHRRN
jgi:hypothetical protein